MSESLNARQKAAALILSIGPENAGHLLQHLSEEEVSQLAAEVASLSEVGSDERQALFVETVHGAARAKTMGGVDRARELLARYGNGELVLDDGGPTVFAALAEHPAMRVTQLLKDEHPQVITVVLADQRPEFAAKVLSTFSEELRKDVSYRIAALSQPNPDFVSDLRAALAGRSTSAEHRRSQSVDGAKDLAQILNEAGKDSEDEILEYVGGVDPAVADRVRALMFVFEDIAELDDRAIQAILKNVDSGTLSFALKGVASRVQDAILRNLSERARTALVEEMDLMGPTRRSEVETAQQQIIAELRTLEEAGEVVLGRGGGDDLIA